MGLTPSYCPPEIRFHDYSKICPEADIFSFGVYLYFNFINYRILYEFISERRAWTKNQRQDPSSIYNLIRNSNFSFFMANIPTGIYEIDELISNCTSIDVKKRPSAIEVLERIKIIKFWNKSEINNQLIYKYYFIFYLKSFLSIKFIKKSVWSCFIYTNKANKIYNKKIDIKQ